MPVTDPAAKDQKFGLHRDRCDADGLQPAADYDKFGEKRVFERIMAGTVVTVSEVLPAVDARPESKCSGAPESVESGPEVNSTSRWAPVRTSPVFNNAKKP